MTNTLPTNERHTVTDAKITLTAKAGTSFDAPWIVAHVDTVDEGRELLADALDKGLDTDLADFSKMFQAKYALSSGGLAPQPTATRAPAQPVAQPAPAQPAAGEACVHGEMTFREGTSSKGPWTGYFCPSPKGTPDQCSPHFVR